MAAPERTLVDAGPIVALLVGMAVQLLGCSQDFVLFYQRFFRSPGNSQAYYVVYDPLDLMSRLSEEEMKKQSTRLRRSKSLTSISRLSLTQALIRSPIKFR